MSVFGTIIEAIFGGPAAASTATDKTAAPGKPATGANPVDVAAMLDKLQKQSRENFDWRRSIVDLMKLLNLDSSLKARKELAQELGYTGSTADSAAMNIWLHKQVMAKLVEHGGIVPDELKS